VFRMVLNLSAEGREFLLLPSWQGWVLPNQRAQRSPRWRTTTTHVERKEKSIPSRQERHNLRYLVFWSSRERKPPTLESGSHFLLSGQ
jgi:hypothetical protein